MNILRRLFRRRRRTAFAPWAEPWSPLFTKAVALHLIKAKEGTGK